VIRFVFKINWHGRRQDRRAGKRSGHMSTQASQSSVEARKVVHADIKPKNPPERAAHYLDVPNMPWEPTKFPGIKIKVLYTDDSGITTALFKLHPGRYA
jgi:hypothetical protein